VLTLPRGLVGDTHRATAELRPVTGWEEERLASRSDAPVAETVTELLARSIYSLGGLPATLDDVRALSIGDREALLLHLRRETLGPRIDCVATCPAADCRERLDLTLSVDELLVERGAESAASWYDETFSFPSSVRVVFRVPNGADQEAAAAAAGIDAAAGAALLLERCVKSTSNADGQPAEVGDELADAIAARMAELDPQAEITLLFDCAACGRSIVLLFDTGSFFLAEMEASAGQLPSEVHAIAWHYHWSEREILDLPRDKRRRYLELIAESVTPRQARSVA
jgi:hypothetical protein